MEESLSLAGDTCGEVAELVKDSGEVDKKIFLLLLVVGKTIFSEELTSNQSQ